MSAPDRREWFRRDGRDFHEVFNQEARAIAEQWVTADGVPPLLRVTAVGEDWYCLDGWIGLGPHSPDQVELPTEADIPVGFV